MQVHNMAIILFVLLLVALAFAVGLVAHTNEPKTLATSRQRNGTFMKLHYVLAGDCNRVRQPSECSGKLRQMQQKETTPIK